MSLVERAKALQAKRAAGGTGRARTPTKQPTGAGLSPSPAPSLSLATPAPSAASAASRTPPRTRSLAERAKASSAARASAAAVPAAEPAPLGEPAPLPPALLSRPPAPSPAPPSSVEPPRPAAVSPTPAERPPSFIASAPSAAPVADAVAAVLRGEITAAPYSNAGSEPRTLSAIIYPEYTSTALALAPRPGGASDPSASLFDQKKPNPLDAIVGLGPGDGDGDGGGSSSGRADGSSEANSSTSPPPPQPSPPLPLSQPPPTSTAGTGGVAAVGSLLAAARSLPLSQAVSGATPSPRGGSAMVPEQPALQPWSVVKQRSPRGTGDSGGEGDEGTPVALSPYTGRPSVASSKSGRWPCTPLLPCVTVGRQARH
jgi:hypothetical protein